jgi:adenylate cyclase
VISRSAAARLEGYFRLEWTLADERVRMMARDRVFIVPVCIDATRDAGAPESFLRAQWTRLDAGAVPPEFAARIRALLDRLDAPTPADPFHASASASPDRTAGGPERPAAEARSPRVAVLPFADMSASRDQEYFCAGTAEEITNALARVRGLQVASRSAAFHFKDHVLHPSEIGRLLNVSALLQGSVRKMDARVRVSAQLVDTADGFTLWSETYDRELRDIFAVQEDIARHVVAALKVRLLQGEAGLLQWRGTLNLQAYEYYLRGRQLLNKEKEAEQRAAVELFRESIRLDPAFAYAYAGLADVLTQLLRNRNVVSDATAADTLAASARAIELAPDLADAHVASGNALQLVSRDADAEAAFQRALRLDPHHFHAHYWFAKYWASRGEHAAAARHYELAFEIQPDDYRPVTLALQEYQALHDPVREQHACGGPGRPSSATSPSIPDDSYANDHAAGVLMLLGRREEAMRILDRALMLRPDDYRTLYTAACTAALGGMYDARI